jgi:Holliday junction resolvase RusA-like endonuclease
MEIVISLPGVPQGKGRPRFVRKTGHAFTPAKTRSYESLLQGAAIDAMRGFSPIEGPIRAHVEAYFPVPASWSKAKQASARLGMLRPAKKPDADNLLKILDAFNEVVFRDDAQIVSATVDKHYSDQPRLVVRISKAAFREGAAA